MAVDSVTKACSAPPPAKLKTCNIREGCLTKQLSKILLNRCCYRGRLLARPKASCTFKRSDIFPKKKTARLYQVKSNGDSEGQRLQASQPRDSLQFVMVETCIADSFSSKSSSAASSCGQHKDGASRNCGLYIHSPVVLPSKAEAGPSLNIYIWTRLHLRGWQTHASLILMPTP